MFSLRTSSLNRHYWTSSKHTASYMTSLILAVLVAIDVTHGLIQLEKINTIYLSRQPTATGSGSFMFPSNAVEDSAFDKHHNMIYTVGNKYLRAIDASDLNRMVEVTHVEEPGSEFNSVHICGRFLITSVPNNDVRHLGRVIIYDTITPNNRQFVQLHSITVGSSPNHIAMTRDCKTFVFGLEGYAFAVDQSVQLIDPEGGIGVLHFPNGIDAFTVNAKSQAYDYIRLNFTKFNARTEELVNQGVRFIYRITNSTLSRDLEPEYVVLSDDEKTAYVGLQENNAIAVLNLANIRSPDITAILPLGYKNWFASALDASDRDGAVNLLPHPIYGMFQPDGLAFKRIAGVPYIFTANEGDDKHYPKVGWSEVKRGRDFILDRMITKDAPQRFVAELDDMKLLGRLEFTMDDGAYIYTGVYNKLYTFGGRSFSIFRADDMHLVYDSGDHVERSHAEKYPALFNADSKRYMNTLKATADLRSDNKGPECESILLAEVNNKLLIFVGNERPGTISIYSIENDNVVSPQFESLNYGGEIISGQTWQESYQNRTIGDIDPESLVFVPANENPSGEPILIVTGAVSGTISVYAIRDRPVTEAPSSINVAEPSATQLDPIKSSVPGNPLEVTDLIGQTTVKTLSPNDFGPDSAVTKQPERKSDGTRGSTVKKVRDFECPVYSIKCRNHKKCVPRQLRCDGIDDCGDWTDEVNCDPLDILRGLLDTGAPQAFTPNSTHPGAGVDPRVQSNVPDISSSIAALISSSPVNNAGQGIFPQLPGGVPFDPATGVIPVNMQQAHSMQQGQYPYGGQHELFPGITNIFNRPIWDTGLRHQSPSPISPDRAMRVNQVTDVGSPANNNLLPDMFTTPETGVLPQTPEIATNPPPSTNVDNFTNTDEPWTHSALDPSKVVGEVSHLNLIPVSPEVLIPLKANTVDPPVTDVKERTLEPAIMLETTPVGTDVNQDLSRVSPEHTADVNANSNDVGSIHAVIGQETKEFECPVYAVKCRNFQKCVSRQQTCDGIDDCGDMSDEVLCNNTIIDQIFVLCIAAIILGSSSIIISLLVCCFLKKRSVSYGKYEMKPRV